MLAGHTGLVFDRAMNTRSKYSRHNGASASAEALPNEGRARCQRASVLPQRRRTRGRGGGAVPPSRSCGAPASGPSARQVRHWPGRATHAHGEEPLQPPKKATASGAGQPPTRFRGSCRKSTSSNLNMQSSQRCVSVQGEAHKFEWQACLGAASLGFSPGWHTLH